MVNTLETIPLGNSVDITDLENCAKFAYDTIGNRWMSHILYALYLNDTMRYGELARVVPQISHKMLDQQLKKLLDRGLIQRKDYYEKPLKVEYHLTTKGEEVVPLILSIVDKFDFTQITEGHSSTEECQFESILKIIKGKWKTSILIILFEHHKARYNQIRSILPNVTNKHLSTQLKKLEAEGYINRIEYLEIPPRVEYSLTEKGINLLPILETIIYATKNILSLPEETH